MHHCYCLIGLTGSGKSTLARMAQQHRNTPVVSSGDIARSIAARDPFTKAALNQGDYAPEQSIRQAVTWKIQDYLDSKPDGVNSHLVIEGFPRTIAQFVMLEQEGWRMGFQTHYFKLEVPPYVCIQRLTRRQREGDNPDSIAAKIEHFTQHTEPMLDIINTTGIHSSGSPNLAYIAGDMEPEQVWSYFDRFLTDQMGRQ